tara:strand:- start:13433 stop:13954 length:522 start_codon:yes stop_codon:yes gene_type:complete
MIVLQNGNGQLGKELEYKIRYISPGFRLSPKVVFIYHTWDMRDKNDKKAQKNCYKQFKKFVDTNKEHKIIFTSTYSEQNNFYNFYKQKAGGYLLANHKQGKVIKLPVLLGKGVCQDLKENKCEPYGVIELMSLHEAADEILRIAFEDTNNKEFRLHGTQIPAKFVQELLQFNI